MRTGYKGFDERDGKLYCRDMEYKVGEIAEVEGPLEICKNGIHFCWKVNDVSQYYSLSCHVICEVEPLGEIITDSDGNKCCTDRLKVIRVLTREEILELSNTGKENTGYMNTGDRNIGDWNTGGRNTGYRNTGGRNTGNWNTGYRNTGDLNTGDLNAGDRNTGELNTGNWNTGDRNIGVGNTGDGNIGGWNVGHDNAGNFNVGGMNIGDWNTGGFNKCNYSTGFFNTEERECYIFDSPSGMTTREFYESKYYTALEFSPFRLTEWIEYSEEEKRGDKAKELIGGYLKKYSFHEACANWWKRITPGNKRIITEIPNFDPDKFKMITGIDVRAEGLWE